MIETGGLSYFLPGQSKEHEELAELREQLEEERRTLAQTSLENTQLQSDVRALRTEVWNCTRFIGFFVKFMSFHHTVQRSVVGGAEFCFDLDLHIVG